MGMFGNAFDIGNMVRGQSDPGMSMGDPYSQFMADQQNGGQLPLAAYSPMPAQPQLPGPIPTPTPQAKPGFFAEGGTGSKIADVLGYLGGGIAQAGGGQNTFGPMMEERKKLSWQMNKQAQQQALEFQRQLALEQWKRENPEVPTEIQNFNAYQNMTPEQQRAFDAFKPIIQMGQYGAQVFSHDQIAHALGGSGTAAPTVLPTKDKLTPITLGGPTPPASGTFS